jgi:hypothetical protein
MEAVAKWSGGFSIRKGIANAVEMLVLFASFMTNTGVALFMDWADDVVAHTGATAEYIGWGTSATTAAKTDTDLGTAAYESRTSSVHSQSAADTYQWLGTITGDASATYPRTIKEVALFSAAGSGNPPSGGTCIIHANHTDAVVTVSGDKVDYTILLQLTN